MSDITIRVVGVGSSVEVEVPQESTVSDALAEAGIDAEAAGLNTRVNGESAAQDAPLADGDAVSTTPREAKLG